VEAMARCCISILEDCERARGFGKAARMRAAKLFHFKNIIPKYEAIYGRLVARRGAYRAPLENGPAVSG
jgi:glycosyltransferase involved in cell wall biosynthesis